MTIQSKSTRPDKGKKNRPDLVGFVIVYIVIIILADIVTLIAYESVAVTVIMITSLGGLVPLILWRVLRLHKSQRSVNWFMVLFIVCCGAIGLPTPLRTLLVDFFLWLTGGR